MLSLQNGRYQLLSDPRLGSGEPSEARHAFACVRGLRGTVPNSTSQAAQKDKRTGDDRDDQRPAGPLFPSHHRFNNNYGSTSLIFMGGGDRRRRRRDT